MKLSGKRYAVLLVSEELRQPLGWEVKCLQETNPVAYDTEQNIAGPRFLIVESHPQIIKYGCFGLVAQVRHLTIINFSPQDYFKGDTVLF